MGRRWAIDYAAHLYHDLYQGHAVALGLCSGRHFELCPFNFSRPNHIQLIRRTVLPCAATDARACLVSQDLDLSKRDARLDRGIARAHLCRYQFSSPPCIRACPGQNAAAFHLAAAVHRGVAGVLLARSGVVPGGNWGLYSRYLLSDDYTCSVDDVRDARVLSGCRLTNRVARA